MIQLVRRDGAQLPAVHQLFHFPVYMVGTLVEHHTEHHARPLGGLVHLPHLLGVHARRLLHHDVQPALEGLHG